jgi:membrane associated rhomboid family serine protease
MWAVLLTYIFIDLSGLTATTNVANEAHLLGVLAGLIIGYNHRGKKHGKKQNKRDPVDVEKDTWKQRIKEWEEKWMMN